MLIADPVDEQFDFSTRGADVHIERLPIHKKLAEIAEPKAPAAASLVKFL